MLLVLGLNMLLWARCLLKCTKISRARPSLTFQWWFGVASPAQPGLVARGRRQDSLQREMVPSELAGGAEGSPAPRSLPWPSPGSRGSGASQALTHGPQRLAPVPPLYQRCPRFTGIRRWGILPPALAFSLLQVWGRWQFKEVLGVEKVSALYSSACFSENPSLVGTSLKQRSIWMRLEG